MTDSTEKFQRQYETFVRKKWWSTRGKKKEKKRRRRRVNKKKCVIEGDNGEQE
jgi:hypothetical protein